MINLFRAQSIKYLFIIIGLIMFMPTGYAFEQDKTYQLTILHTNDHHGHFWQNAKGEYGLAAQKTLIDRIRAEVKQAGGSVLLISAGDINTGVPESDLLKAEPDFKGMRLIGYDAMVVGNHEFDNPLSVLRQQQQWAGFPFLAANIYVQATQGNPEKRLFDPYVIFEKQGLKIAVIGLSTEETPAISDPENVQGLEFRNPIAAAKLIIQELKKTQQPDIIIAATHMGHYDDGKHGSNAAGDVEMARELTYGDLDLIIGGHSHGTLCLDEVNTKQVEHIPGGSCIPDQQNGIWILQANDLGKYVGRADFEFKNGVFKLKKYQLIPVNLIKKDAVAESAETSASPIVYYADYIEPNQAMLDLLQPYQAQGQLLLDVKIGSINGKLEGDRNIVRTTQTNLSRMILSAFIERTHADFGVMNSGGIRASIASGDIVYKDVLQVLPFGNTLVYIDMHGSEIINYLDNILDKTAGSGGYPQLMNIQFEQNENEKITKLNINNQPLNLDKTYRIVMSKFASVGGDAYPKLNHLVGYVDTGILEAGVIREYIEKSSPLDIKKFTPQSLFIEAK